MDTKKLTITEAGIVAILKEGPAHPFTLLQAGTFVTVNRAIAGLKAIGLIEEFERDGAIWLRLVDSGEKDADTVK